MREIKFRAYQNDDDYTRMVCFQLGDIHQEGLIVYGNSDSIGDYDYIDMQDGLPIMQFIGLKDMYLKDIYEGDIVNIDMGRLDPDKKEVVFGGHWKYAGFGLHGKRKDRGKDNWETKFTWDALNPETAKKCEIIGNIHENPELLNA